MLDDRRTTALAGATAGILSRYLPLWSMAAVCCSASNAAVFFAAAPVYISGRAAGCSEPQSCQRAGLVEHFVFHSSTHAAVVRLLEPCHPQTPSVGSLKGLATCRRHPGRRRLRRVRCLSSPTVQPFGRHQRRCRAGSKPAQGIDQNKTAPG